MALYIFRFLIISTLIIIPTYYSFATPNKLSSSLPGVRILQTRYGYHINHTRVVLDISNKVDYQIIRISEREYVVELLGFQQDQVEMSFPKDNEFVHNIHYINLTDRVAAHILLKKPAYIIRHFTLNSPERIFIDFSNTKGSYDFKIVDKEHYLIERIYLSFKEIKNIQNEKNKPALTESAGIKSSITKTKLPEQKLNEHNVDSNKEKSNDSDPKININNFTKVYSSDSKETAILAKAEMYFSKLSIESEDESTLDEKSFTEGNAVIYTNTNISDIDNLELDLPYGEHADKFGFQEYSSFYQKDDIIQNSIYKLSINQNVKNVHDKLGKEYFRQWGFSKLNFTPLFLDGLVNIEAEMAYNPEDSQDFTDLMLEGFQEYRNNMNRIKVNGSFKGFDYGAKYLYVNDNFDKVPGTKLGNDEQGGELWLDRKVYIFRLKTFYSTYWDNVSKDPDEDRKTVKKLGATFSIEPENLPFISFTYSRGDSKKSRFSGSSNINKDDIDSFSTYISYYKDNWVPFFLLLGYVCLKNTDLKQLRFIENVQSKLKIRNFKQRDIISD